MTFSDIVRIVKGFFFAVNRTTLCRRILNPSHFRLFVSNFCPSMSHINLVEDVQIDLEKVSERRRQVSLLRRLFQGTNHRSRLFIFLVTHKKAVRESIDSVIQFFIGLRPLRTSNVVKSFHIGHLKHSRNHYSKFNVHTSIIRFGEEAMIEKKREMFGFQMCMYFSLRNKNFNEKYQIYWDEPVQT